MQPAKILVELRRVLSPAEAPFVLAALTEDALVWNSLQDPEYLDSVLSDESCIPSSWSPANLALRSLGNRISFTDLTAEHIPGIEPSLRKQALELLETTLRSGQPVTTLSEAGLVALALRERRRKTQSWRGFLGELLSIPPKSGQGVSDVWKTPLACLYGIIPDKWDFLESLLPQESMHPSIDWISHIILSDPVDPEAQTRLLHDLMSQLVVEYQVEWLRFLIGKGRYALAAGIADQLLTTGREFLNSLEADFDPDHAEWVMLSRKVLDNQLAATLYQISGRPLQAGVYLDKTRTLLQHWLVGSSLQMANVIDREGKSNQSAYEECADLMTLLPVSDLLKDEAILLSGSEVLGSRLLNRSDGRLSAVAHLALPGEKPESFAVDEASEEIREIVNEWLSSLDQDRRQIQGQFVFEWNPMQILNSLLEKRMESEAVALAERFLVVRSEDKNLLNWLADTSHMLGNDEKALDYRMRLILAQPEDPDHLRKLAALYEDRREWNAALEERQKVVQAAPVPSFEDRLALASCAIDAHNFPEAVDTCQKILLEDPDHGMAYTLLGKACLAQGDVDSGINHLSKAVGLIPEFHTAWFELAEAFKRKGDTQKVLETLREAVLTAPDSSELHYALGKAYLDNSEISDALPFLRQSARLAPESVEIARELAEALITLGYKKEALEVIEKARNRWRVNPELAYLHGKMLIKEGDSDQGVATLEIALQSENPKAEWYILLAQSLIGDTEEYLTGGEFVFERDRLDRALNALQKAVTLQPHSFQALLLTAESLLLRGESQSAFEVYRNLIELPEAVHDEWYWRLQSGFGRAALNLGQTETALASLQNAVTANPTSVGLLRILTEAFAAASLAENAAETAEQALALAPEQSDNLAWYAGVMSGINQTEKAVAALRTALELNPDAVGLSLKLAEIQLTKGDHDAARTELAAAVDHPLADISHLQGAAEMYLKIEESLKALAVLEKAAGLTSEPEADLLFELAVLYNKAGKHEQALETIQKALQHQSNQPAYFILQADLLEKQNHSQGALDSLEHALELSESRENLSTTVSSATADHRDPFHIASSPVEVHVLLTQLHQKMGNLSQAMDHAEKALLLQPESTEIRFIGAEMAAKLLLNDRAARLMAMEKSPDEQTHEDINVTLKPDPWMAGLYSLRGEFLIEAGDNQGASRFITEGLKYDPSNPRLGAAKVILLARNGEWIEATQLFANLWLGVEPAMKVKTIRSLSDERKISIPDGTLLAVAEAAVELYRWPQAIQLLEYVVRRQPVEPLALFRQVRTMVRAAEWYFTGSKIGSIVHLPDEFVTSEAAYNNYFQAVSELKKINNSPEINRWWLRGEVVFHPSAETIRRFTDHSLSGEDAAALLAGLNRIGNVDGARQVGEQFNSNPSVCIQLSLVDDPDDGGSCQDAGARAVSFLPNNPICHAALAYAADKNGDVSRALEAVENAIIFWPDESGWQYWAAKLAIKSNELEAARIHLEKTHALVPANLDVILELGSVYQDLKEGPSAVAVLHKAVQIAPSNPGAWLSFANALKLNEQPSDALKAAAQAVQTGGEERYRALILSGEIYLEAGEDKKAMEFARQAEKSTPMQAETRLLTSKILTVRGKEKDALSELNRAIEELPGVLDLELERGRLVHKLYGAGSALQVVQPLAEKYPENDRVVGMFASVLADSGRFEDAEKAALQTLRINSKNPEIHLLLGRLFTNSGQLDKAVHHLSEAAIISPDLTDAYLDLGTVYSIRRDFDQALDSYQQAIATAPEDHRAYYQAGLILRDSKDYQNAEHMLRRAVTLAPQDVNIRRQLGAIVALNLVHNCQEASSCL